MNCCFSLEFFTIHGIINVHSLHLLVLASVIIMEWQKKCHFHIPFFVLCKWICVFSAICTKLNTTICIRIYMPESINNWNKISDRMGFLKPLSNFKTIRTAGNFRLLGTKTLFKVRPIGPTNLAIFACRAHAKNVEFPFKVDKRWLLLPERLISPFRNNYVFFRWLSDH